MSKRKTVKKSISLRDDVFETAEKEADKFFGGNFSAYLTYLICADKYGVSRGVNIGEDEPISKEKVMESVRSYTKSEENDDYINSILNIKPK